MLRSRRGQRTSPLVGLPLRTLVPAILVLLGAGAWGAALIVPGTAVGLDRAEWSGGASSQTHLTRDSIGARPRMDGDRLLEIHRTLAHDSMEGRRTGTPGAERARRILIPAFEAAGLEPVGGTAWTHPFTYVGRVDTDPQEGINILGWVRGTEFPDRFLVITAHYDHLGVRGEDIFNGADDNASGTAAILMIGEWLSKNPPRHSVIFAALDAEEVGLRGARAFVQAPPIPQDQILMNLNLDMVSRSEARELYAAGTYHSPFLIPVVEAAARVSGIRLLMGHDRPGLPPGDDWTMSSDHGPFHQAGIPFLYFGNEDHPGYHNPTDTHENITPAFYVEAVETILDVILLIDREGARSGFFPARSPARP
jgi:hypothetical protein